MKMTRAEHRAAVTAKRAANRADRAAHAKAVAEALAAIHETAKIVDIAIRYPPPGSDGEYRVRMRVNVAGYTYRSVGFGATRQEAELAALQDAENLVSDQSRFDNIVPF